MNKLKIIFLIVFVFGIVSLLTYLNYDKILSYMTNKQWELADSTGKIELENYLDTFGTNSVFFVVNSSGIQGYSNDSKKVLDEAKPFKEVVSSSAGEYAIVAEKNSTNVFTFCKTNKIIDKSINNANIMGVTINKNGYSAVIYSQAGYKSLIKVFSNTGDELFTSYLASTYAIDVTISNDNKYLAIAEIDTNGVGLMSAIKLINIQSASEESVKKIDIENGEVISDIEYDSSNQLVILTDMGVRIMKNDKIVELLNYEDDNFLFANITNGNNLVTIKVKEESLFNIICSACIYSFNDVSDMKQYDFHDTPNKMVIYDDKIAVDTGNTIVFLNTSGNFVKKCEYSGQLKDIVLFDKGNMAVMLFRDTAEFVKIGGI